MSSSKDIGSSSKHIDETADSYRVKVLNNDETTVWPKITAQKAKQLNLENTDKLEVAGKIQATDLEVSGTVTATSFIGEISGLTEKVVSKAGDIMTGSLTIGQTGQSANLTVNGTVSATKFVGDGSSLTGIPSASEKVSKAGDIMTGSLTIGQTGQSANLTVNGTVSATKFVGDGSSLTGIPSASQWVGDKTKISFDGKVGIGTESPVSKLHVVGGDIRVDNGEYQSWGPITFHPDVDKSGDSIVRFLNSTGSENMRIDAKGNVGIGTTNPGAILEIFSSPPDNDPRGGGYIKFFNKSTEWLYECSYDGGADGVFYFTNLSDENGSTGFQSLTAGPILTIHNKGWIEADLQTCSSRELKENIIEFSTHEAREVLAGLNPVKFNYRSDEEERLRAGFIAEDTPDLLASKDKKTISPLDIVAVLTKVIKQQQEELSSLKEQLNALEAKV